MKTQFTYTLFLLFFVFPIQLFTQTLKELEVQYISELEKKQSDFGELIKINDGILE
ncbi:MAG: hypothetical protein IPJ45_09540 [Ignavibacteria bacterium]|nr:hypothetical protein [Ignavibacteria bacterium]